MASVYEYLEGGLPRELFIKPTKTHYEIAEVNGIARKTVDSRINLYGWSLERAIIEPVNKSESKELYERYSDETEKSGINFSTFVTRLNRGWEPERAATEPVKKREPKIKFTSKELWSMHQIKLPPTVASIRINNGWDRERAISQPLRKRGTTQ